MRSDNFLRRGRSYYQKESQPWQEDFFVHFGWGNEVLQHDVSNPQVSEANGRHASTTRTFLHETAIDLIHQHRTDAVVCNLVIQLIH
jgi:hypothetical protein